MQFRDLKKQYDALKHEIDAGIADVIGNSQFIGGGKVREFEERIAESVGRKYCVSCANGTDALEMMLRTWGIGENDAVFVPSFTFMSTAEVVSLVGAQPFFVDIDAETFNMDAGSLESTIKIVLEQGEYTPRAVIPVDLFGLPADFEKIRETAGRYGLLVLEDGAQGYGGSIAGKRACSFGDASTTSFFPAKPLGCYGDGGAIFTDSEEDMLMLRSLCVHGKGKEKYENIRIGRNSRLDSLQAAILLPKLKAFWDHELQAVNQVAERYTSLLKDCVKTPTVKAGFRSSWAQYTVLCADAEQRNSLQQFLKSSGIPSMVYYPLGLHQQQAFAESGLKNRPLPVTEAMTRRVLSLPMHPYLSESEIDNIAERVKIFMKGIK